MKTNARVRTERAMTVMVTVGIAVLALGVGPAFAGIGTARVSVASNGGWGNANMFASDTAGTGRYVVFESAASNLVSGDTNGVSDIFLRDRSGGTTTRVSITNSGGQANGESHSAKVSADGRYVVFESFATNLVSGDTNGTWDVFIRDRTNKTTSRLSVSSTGVQGNSYSADPVLSNDGRYVAYESNASNLVSGDTNGWEDVFVRDRSAGTTSRISVGANGQGNGSSSDPDITPDGRFVAFESLATNLIKGDTNSATDIYLRDRTNHVTTRVSIGAGGVEANGPSYSVSISSTGRYVSFESFATNLVTGDTNGYTDVFVRDRTGGTTNRLSITNSGGQALGGYSADPSISDDGMYVVFESQATNLVSGDTNAVTDVFLRNRVAKTTTRVSVTSGGGQANGESSDPAISNDGKVAMFESDATNIVSGDTNGHTDVFARGPLHA